MYSLTCFWIKILSPKVDCMTLVISVYDATLIHDWVFEIMLLAGIENGTLLIWCKNSCQILFRYCSNIMWLCKETSGDNVFGILCTLHSTSLKYEEGDYTWRLVLMDLQTNTLESVLIFLLWLVSYGKKQVGRGDNMALAKASGNNGILYFSWKIWRVQSLILKLHFQRLRKIVLSIPHWLNLRMSHKLA